MPTRLISELERIRYREGQLLAARDLQDEKDFEALLRGMHTRFLHDTWGIALGLDVEPVELADTSKVRVSPGLAYDGYGRELLLTHSIKISVPSVKANEERYLVIRYKDDAEFPSKPEVVAVCTPGVMDPQQERTTLHPIEEQPVFLWRRPAAVRLGEEIPLARIQLNAEGNVSLDRSVRRNARPLMRPHVGYGLALMDFASMAPWTVVTENEEVTIGRQIKIDTSEAGFTQTPCYIVQAKLLIQLPGTQTQLSLPVPWFESIADAQAEEFTYRMSFEPETELGDIILSVSVKISIFWIGVEPRIVTFAGRVVGLPEDKRLGLWHIQVEGETQPWLVRVSMETVVDESEAQAKLDTWAEIQARPVIDGFWEAVHIKLYDLEERA